MVATRSYSCPRKYKEAWKTLLNQYLKAGRIQPSSSPYASPAFLVPKPDPTVLPRWVNDYRKMNENTVRNQTPLPRIDEILADCAGAKYYAKMDATNSFFQTRVHPDSVHLTAVTTPFGLYEWLVMPMGGSNAPATHQCRMFHALKDLIGRICHVYLDNIIIWSNSLEEHKANIDKVMEALCKANLYMSIKKTNLFCLEVLFLGHILSADGVQPDPSKVERITLWPVPKSTTDVRAFLGIV